MSFTLDIHPEKMASAEFISEVGMELREALLHQKSENQLTQQELAARLGVNKSRINRCFSGFANLTIGTIAELAWALGYTPTFKLEKHADNIHSNFYDGCDYERINNIVVHQVKTAKSLQSKSTTKLEYDNA